MVQSWKKKGRAFIQRFIWDQYLFGRNILKCIPLTKKIDLSIKLNNNKNRLAEIKLKEEGREMGGICQSMRRAEESVKIYGEGILQKQTKWKSKNITTIVAILDNVEKKIGKWKNGKHKKKWNQNLHIVKGIWKAACYSRRSIIPPIAHAVTDEINKEVLEVRPTMHTGVTGFREVESNLVPGRKGSSQVTTCPK